MKTWSIVFISIVIVLLGVIHRCNIKQDNVTEFNYKGHYYIYFNSDSIKGIVHNPECKGCYNKFD